MSPDLSGIDVVSNDVYLDGVPHTQLATLRAHAPVFAQKVPDPALVDEVWVVSTAELVTEVNADAETFSSQANGVQLKAARVGEGLRVNAGNFINLDDPGHKRMRAMVSRAFTPKVVASFAAHYGALTRAVLDRALPGAAPTTLDFVPAIAAELPLLAICELLGAPESDRSRVFSWSNAILGFDDPEYGGSPADAGRAVVELGRYALELADARRACPADDLVSVLATAPQDQRLTSDELEGFVLLLLVAGNETTRNNISHGLVALMEHPAQWDALRADPGLLDSAVEEITRWASPVNYMGRTATRDTVLGGERIAAGERVAMFYSSANRDETAFPGGDVFDITHGYRRHLAFGHGRHFCLGAHLARIETRAVLAELTRRAARVRPAGPVHRLRSGFVNGIKHLPVEITPA